ncbi:CDP-archaeol synthase [Ramlibacter ginsenosidimutans]|uniref:CDP-archaeol synthase n=1 Tax=Ramlibacter ginsenosidimutans TaxID=502333 RepID=A0A934WKE3_9BURK|nr:CDP-archaeol synthase [Ramlibacter ginsenosidimutans]MBK6004520.1 CDP-archaeol synthase [Ramlibacter ginsenosidimutans]
MDDFWLALRLLLLLTVANNGPIAAKLLLRARWDRPIDGGVLFRDGRPLLGHSKTWRGLASAVLLSALLAPVLGFSAAIGALTGALSMVGDALASFTKRRLGVPTSGRSFGLDQLPEAVLPLLVLHEPLQLSWPLITGVAVAFLLLETPAARLAHRLGWRDTPH